ncbi:MAG: hypothetical protein HeimC2_03860 [Candidatus Heimdallarchaeota archaeon LC_2]|nr:MAG: hypothetical protein HeimC2_03860 [Candidatus Heimdallarchaeota archaeon LC_2]
MTFEELSEQLSGKWMGEYLLWLNPTQPSVKCNSTSSIQKVVMDRYMKIDYAWEYDGKKQEGLLIFRYNEKKKKILMTWIDSWHQPDFMLCEGSIDSDNKISAKGSYEALEGPNWEWRTKIIPKSSDAFTFEMYNILPDGTEALAVQVEYKRNIT